MTFTHLEVHSHFTLLGATTSVPELVARARADGMSHLALTDTNALYGVVAFARACREAGIRPIIGMTVTVAPPSPPDEKIGEGRAAQTQAGKLVLLARDLSGYRSLCRLSSLIQGTPAREAIAARGISLDDVAAHRQGLICLSGGREGWVERYLRAGDYGSALRYAGRLAGIFEGDAYLVLELHEPADEGVAGQVAAIGHKLGLPTVAVQPVYCLAPDHAARLRLLAAIRQNIPLDELVGDGAGRSSSPDDAARKEWHWLSPAEVAERFHRFPQAVAMAGEIAARCGPALPDGHPIWPSLKLPDGQTPDQALAALAWAGLRARYGSTGAPDVAGSPQRPGEAGPSAAPAEVRKRLEDELAAIARHGYAPLFLIVADVVRFARSRDIPVSTRGSVANSLVAYCTGITTVDPVAHGLIFERFLNPARANPPDIDLDLCSRRRDEVLEYVRATYGAEHVALVGTVSTMRPQSAVREVGKAYGLPEAEIGRLADMMPGGWHPDPRRRDQRTLADVLATLADARHREVVAAAWELIGQPDHLSVHPGGVVITPGPLTDIVPVQWAPKGFLITQFEHGDVESLGLPKIDLLGIRALTVLADAAALVRRDCDPDFRLDCIPPDDRETGDLIERGETIGVFQCESEGAQRTLRKLRARRVADLAIANAFFKPGPAMGGMADAFVRRYRGEEPVTFLHPALAPILGNTRGVLIFQEQVLRLAREIAGLSWEQADLIRRGMSHFGADQMQAVRGQFVAGCMRPPPDGPGLTASQAQTLWEQILPFAGYGFNQGHATAYAEVSYRSAYLKAHYPAQFLCARLADWGGFHHPAIYMAEAVRLGFAVRPPHVNFSGEAFTLTNQRISESASLKKSHSPFADMPLATLYMGLGQVRDLRGSAIAALLQERAQGLFTGLRDLLRRVPLRPKETDHLIRCGALDGLGESRAALLAEAEQIRRSDARQLAFDFARPTVPAETLRQRWDWEAELLGLPVSALADPLALVRDRLPPHIRLVELPASGGRSVTTAGVRLPGWTGGPGFFLGDGHTFVIVKGSHIPRSPTPWQPLLVSGRWIGDSWGTFWLQASAVAPV